MRVTPHDNDSVSIMTSSSFGFPVIDAVPGSESPILHGTPTAVPIDHRYSQSSSSEEGGHEVEAAGEVEGDNDPNAPPPPEYVEETVPTYHQSNNEALQNPLPDYQPLEDIEFVAALHASTGQHPALDSHDKELLVAFQAIASRIWPWTVMPLASDLEASAQARIAKAFMTAIAQRQTDIVALYLSTGLANANTADPAGRTALVEAVRTENVGLVTRLLEAGANKDGYGTVIPSVESIIYSAWDGTSLHPPLQRTALQQAASQGNLTLVKLLMERWSCNDALIAPDGQLALRLAADNGHTDVVAYLPIRRGGGWRRWKAHNAIAVRRIKTAAAGIYFFFKVPFYYIPRVIFWEIPKVAIYKPLRSLYRDRKRIWLGFKARVAEIPGHVVRVAKWFGRGAKWCGHTAKKIPAAIAKTGKAVWTFSTSTLPRWLWKVLTKEIPRATVAVSRWLWEVLTKDVPRVTRAVSSWVWEILTKDIPRIVRAISRFFWNLLTKRIPHAISLFAAWVWRGITATAGALVNVATKLAALLHTILATTLSFFRSITLRDIWNGVVDLLHAVFVAFPSKLWDWLVTAAEVSFKILAGLFGLFGMCVWYAIVGLGLIVTYVPRKLGQIALSVMGSVANGGREVVVFFNPKA